MNKPVETSPHSDAFNFDSVDICAWLKTVSRRTRRGEVVKGCKLAAERIESLIKQLKDKDASGNQSPT